jgi:glutathione S-transferase
MLKLYYSPGACSLGLHILLREINADFELERVLLAERENFTPEYRRINPACRVPALKDGEFVLTESQAIYAHLSAEFGGDLFLAHDLQQRARAFEMTAWLSSTVHIAYAQIWRPERFVSQESDYPPIVKRGEQLISEHYNQIERRLSSTEYIAGHEYSFADTYLFVFYRWGGRIGLDMRQGFPNWARWSERMLERPAVREAMDVEGITLFALVERLELDRRKRA